MNTLLPLTTLGREPEDWRNRALCAEVDPDLFFPDKGQPSAPARRVCLCCEVRPQCLAYALDTGEAHGVWGGVTPDERRALARERRAAA